MKQYEKYTEEYINDSDYVKDGYLVDICDQQDASDNPHNLLRDYITYDFIRQESAIAINGRVYQIHIIYDWIMKQTQDIRDPMKIPISAKDVMLIKHKYAGTKKIKAKTISFYDNISRGDVLLLTGDRCVYAYTWYYNSYEYRMIYGTNSLDCSVATHYIQPDEFIGYVLKSDPDYYAYAAKVHQS
jgi:hypothetical protein